MDVDVDIDHIYIAVTDMAVSELFYDRLFITLGFVKKNFQIYDEDHIHYYNRFFGYVLRPARSDNPHDTYEPGLHHLCLRVPTEADVRQAQVALNQAGIHTTDTANYPQYAEDYFAFFFNDPDGIRLEITNFRKERRERYDHWHDHKDGE